MTNTFRILLVWVSCFLVPFCRISAQSTPTNTAPQLFALALNRLAEIIEPAAGSSPSTFSARLKVVAAEGAARELTGRTIDLAYQAPDRLRLSTEINASRYTLVRNGQELWIEATAKRFVVVGSAGVPRFSAAPEKKDTNVLAPFKLPLPREQLALLPLLMQVQMQASQTIQSVACPGLRIIPQSETVKALKMPNGQIDLWLRETDHFPLRIGYADDQGTRLQVELHDLKLDEPWPAVDWRPVSPSKGKLEVVALSHLTRFLTVALASLNQKVPSLGPATGEHRIMATEGKGRLEMIEGTRVLFLKGTPEEMGRQQGILLRKEVRSVVDRILYGVGVGSSFVEGEWFLGKIEQAQGRLAPFVSDRYLREMDALALAAGIDREESRLANLFPELFHCSGFALFGQATLGGRMYHGRILDYLRGVGLEQNAVVAVVQPDIGHAWVNVGYAGFLGSVTAMNDQHVAIGEMGGRGEGQWDGKPMAQLVREVMEKASNLDEAVDIMRQGPRTCEYYYVISDAKAKRAVGLATSPTRFEMVWPGQSHPQLPHAFPDAVLMSAGDRYEKLAEWVKARYGKIDAEGARQLMNRPVAMQSNIHSVLFAPETLDFWVANADAENVASHTRYTHYNLADLLKSEPGPGGNLQGR